MLEPRFKKLRTEILPPAAATKPLPEAVLFPCTDKPELRRARPRKERVEPVIKKLKTERPEPIRLKLRIEREDPVDT